MTASKRRGIVPRSCSLLNMQASLFPVCVFVWYLSWSCWTEIVRNAEQSALASLPGELRLSFGSCVCLRAGLIWLLCAWDIVPKNWIRKKGWRVFCICSPSSHFLFMTFLCSVSPPVCLSLFLSCFFSHWLCESRARGDDHAVWSVLCIPADRPLPWGS